MIDSVRDVRNTLDGTLAREVFNESWMILSCSIVLIADISCVRLESS
jgi:hypothetical protein